VTLTIPEVLELIPQRRPFRFIDNLLSIDAEHVVGTYRFREDEYFYAGHFPGRPVTPGVILIETMCQIALVAHGMYLLASELGVEQLRQAKVFFTDTEVEFSTPVLPGQTVRVTTKRLYWRRRKLKSAVSMTLEDGTIVASGYVAGMEAPNAIS
jgi:3-hydroxyacyl-[acyl-carrier-protein] dehydratase